MNFQNLLKGISFVCCLKLLNFVKLRLTKEKEPHMSSHTPTIFIKDKLTNDPQVISLSLLAIPLHFKKQISFLLFFYLWKGGRWGGGFFPGLKPGFPCTISGDLWMISIYLFFYLRLIVQNDIYRGWKFWACNRVLNYDKFIIFWWFKMFPIFYRLITSLLFC